MTSPRKLKRSHDARSVGAVALFVALLAGCSGATQPADIAVAEELCSKRGGFTHVARFERGKNLVIHCKDSTQIDMRPGSAPGGD